MTTLVPFVQPLIVSLLWIALAALAREPARQRIQAVIVAVAAGAYMNGGFGSWELAFSVLVAVCAYFGLSEYRWLALGWALHTCWDTAHHIAGRPMITWLPDSSFNCAVTDLVLAAWFLAKAPSPWDFLKRPSRARIEPSA